MGFTYIPIKKLDIKIHGNLSFKSQKFSCVGTRKKRDTNIKTQMFLFECPRNWKSKVKKEKGTVVQKHQSTSN